MRCSRGPAGVTPAAVTSRVYRDGLDGPRGLNCCSGTDGVTRYWKGQRERVVSGLPSVHNPATVALTGPSDSAFLSRGRARVSIGWGGANLALREGLGALGASFGCLVHLAASGPQPARPRMWVY